MDSRKRTCVVASALSKFKTQDSEGSAFEVRPCSYTSLHHTAQVHAMVPAMHECTCLYQFVTHHRSITVPWKAKIHLGNALLRFLIVAGFEWGKAIQELIAKHPKAPDVNTGVMRPLAYHFWCQVVGRSAHCVPPHIWGVHRPSKVGQSQLAIMSNQQVFRLQVPATKNLQSSSETARKRGVG
jgi:hypothetical protein